MISLVKYSNNLNKRSAETLIALEALILSEGFSSLSVSDIASKLKCSKRTLYELAPSKKKSRLAGS